MHSPVSKRSTHDTKEAVLGSHEDVVDRIKGFWKSQAVHGTVVVLHGEAGIGKTSVVERISQTTSDMTVIVGNCLSNKTLTPFFVIGSMISSYIQTLLGLRAPEAIAQVIATLYDGEPQHRPFLPLLNHVFGLPISADPEPGGLGSEQKASKLMELLVCLTQALARKGNISQLMVIIEDVHWMDSASWVLTEHLTQSNLGFTHLTLLTKRHWLDTAPEPYTRLLHRSTTHTVLMPVVKARDVEAIARSVLMLDADATVRIPPEAVDTVLLRSGGNLLFCNELLQMYVSDGALAVAQVHASAGRSPMATASDSPSDTPWRSRSATTDDMVEVVWDSSRAKLHLENVSTIILNRMRELDPFVLEVVQMCTVIGSTFTVKLLERLLPNAAGDRLDTTLHVIEQMGFVVRCDNYFRFFHETYKDTIYDNIHPQRRRRYHRAIAVQIEVDTQDFTGLYALLAFHWLQVVGTSPPTTWQHCCDILRTIEYLKMAAKETLAYNMINDASLLLADALPLVPVHCPPGEEYESTEGLSKIALPSSRSKDDFMRHTSKVELELILLQCTALIALNRVSDAQTHLHRANELCQTAEAVDSDALYALIISRIWVAADQQSFVIAGQMASGLLKTTSELRIMLEFCGFEIFGLMMSGHVSLALHKAKAYTEMWREAGCPKFPALFLLMTGRSFLMGLRAILLIATADPKGFEETLAICESDFDNCVSDKGFTQTILMMNTCYANCFSLTRTLCESQQPLIESIALPLLQRHESLVSCYVRCLQGEASPAECLKEMLVLKGASKATAYYPLLCEVCLHARDVGTARSLLQEWTDAATKQEELLFYSENLRIRAEFMLLQASEAGFSDNGPSTPCLSTPLASVSVLSPSPVATTLACDSPVLALSSSSALSPAASCTPIPPRPLPTQAHSRYPISHAAHAPSPATQTRHARLTASYAATADTGSASGASATRPSSSPRRAIGVHEVAITFLEAAVKTALAHGCVLLAIRAAARLAQECVCDTHINTLRAVVAPVADSVTFKDVQEAVSFLASASTNSAPASAAAAAPAQAGVSASARSEAAAGVPTPSPVLASCKVASGETVPTSSSGGAVSSSSIIDTAAPGVSASVLPSYTAVPGEAVSASPKRMLSETVSRPASSPVPSTVMAAAAAAISTKSLTAVSATEAAHTTAPCATLSSLEPAPPKSKTTTTASTSSANPTNNHTTSPRRARPRGSSASDGTTPVDLVHTHDTLEPTTQSTPSAHHHGPQQHRRKKKRVMVDMEVQTLLSIVPAGHPLLPPLPRPSLFD